MAAMERLDSKILEKYASLKKRKLLDEVLEWKREREVKFKQLHDAMKGLVSDLKKENAELSETLVHTQDELEKVQQEFLEDIRTRDIEILRLKQLLDEKAAKNKPTPPGLLGSTPISPERKTPPSHNRVKMVQFSQNAPHSSPAEEPRELVGSRGHMCISGNATNQSTRVDMLSLLLESLVRLKITVNEETEKFSISASHEASGYSFTLTWLEDSKEWSYKLSSLGTLERIAVDWMRQEIRFSMKMCRMFFLHIAKVIAKG